MAIKKKFISGTPAEAIDGSKILFSNNEAFRVKNASGVAEEVFKLDSSNVLKLLKLPQVAADPSSADDIVRKSFVDAQVAGEAAARGTAVNSLQNSISAETSAREADIAQVVSDYQAADTALEGDLESEEAARVAGDEALDAKIDTEIFDRSAADSLLDGRATALEGRATAVEGRATALEGSVGILNGNSTVENSVDWKVQQGVAQILGGAVPESLDTLAEIASYIASDETGGAALVGRVGVLEGQVETIMGSVETSGSILYAVHVEELRAMQQEQYLVEQINYEQSQRIAAQQFLESSVTQQFMTVNSLISQEQMARESADMTINGQISTLTQSIQSEESARVAADVLLDSNLRAYIDGEVMEEQAARYAADVNLEQMITTEQSVRLAAVENEANIRDIADAALDARLDVLELDPVTKAQVDSGDASTLSSAQSYTDGEITTLKGGVSESYDTLGKIEAKIGFIMSNVDGAALDSLSEIVAAFQGADSDINTAISDLAATAGTNLAAEQTRAQAAEAALGVRIDGVESDLSAEESARIAGDASTLVDAKAYADAQLDTLVIQQQQYTAKTLASGDVSAQYVDVSGPIQGTPWVMIDGVMGRPGVDFTHSGSRITFAGEWATGGESALASGDVLHIFFMKNYNPFV
jgi:hypothetical protein